MRDNNIHNRDFDQEYNTKMTTKQDVQKQIKDLENQISNTSDQAEKSNLQAQRDSLKAATRKPLGLVFSYFYGTTITEDGNVLNHEEHGIISVHLEAKAKLNFSFFL